MSQFLSVIKKNDVVWYLTTKDIESKRGKELRDFCGKRDDLRGHGAIRYFYGIEGGFNIEYTNFACPALLPKELVPKILNGEFARWFGIPPPRILLPQIYTGCVLMAKYLIENYYVRKKPELFINYELKFREFEEFCWQLVRCEQNRNPYWRIF